MHPAARRWLKSEVWNRRLFNSDRVLDLGGRDINGTVHELFIKVRTVDIVFGEGVDIVADAADWEPDDQYEVVLATEVFEHTPRWREIVHTAWKALEPGGVFLATCARDARPAHSAEGGVLQPGEYYGNVSAAEMTATLARVWADWWVLEADGAYGNDDLYVCAIR